MTPQSNPVDIEAMDNLILEVTHNGGQCSQEFDNWSERHRKNWAAIKAEIEALRERVKELEASLKDAVEGMEDMIAYVPEYFVEKWSHQQYIDSARASISPPVEPTKGETRV